MAALLLTLAELQRAALARRNIMAAPAALLMALMAMLAAAAAELQDREGLGITAAMPRLSAAAVVVAAAAAELAGQGAPREQTLTATAAALAARDLTAAEASAVGAAPRLAANPALAEPVAAVVVVMATAPMATARAERDRLSTTRHGQPAVAVLAAVVVAEEGPQPQARMAARAEPAAHTAAVAAARVTAHLPLSAAALAATASSS